MGVGSRLLRFAVVRDAYRRFYAVEPLVESATEATSGALAGLLRRQLPPEMHGDAEDRARRMIEEVRACGGACRTTSAAGQVVGVAQVGPLLRDLGSEEYWIMGLWVDPSWRGRGLGASLVIDSVICAEEDRAPRICAFISANNRTSLNLFASCRFVPDDDPARATVAAHFADPASGHAMKVLRRDLPGPEAG